MTLFELPPPALVPPALIKLDPSAAYVAYRNQGVSPKQAAKKVVEGCCALDVDKAHFSFYPDSSDTEYFFKGTYFGQSLEIAVIQGEDEVMVLDGKVTSLKLWEPHEQFGPEINRRLKNAIIKIFFELGEYQYQKMKQ